VALVRAAVIGGAGTVIALATIACSSLAPIGPARRAQPYPGVSADLAVLVPGALAVLSVVAACAGNPQQAQQAARTLDAISAVNGYLGLLTPGTAGGPPATGARRTP
jgi:hypothetical protein